MDHKETFEFYIADLKLNGISAILGRDWLNNKHKPYVNFEKNTIYFLEKYYIDHCASSEGNKFVFHSKNLTASMVFEDSITYDSLFADELENEQDLCAAVPTVTDKSNEQHINAKKKIINKCYSDMKIAFEKKEADKLPPHRSYDMTIDIIPGS